MTMKKILLSFLALGGLLFASSCQMDEPDAGTLTGEVDFTITAGIPSGISTYAEPAGSGSHNGGAMLLDPDAYTLRYTLEVYDKEGKLAYDETKNAPEGTFEGVTFDVRLLAKVYDFVFWADFVKNDGEVAFYNVDDLTNITYAGTTVNAQSLATDAADAYYKKEEVDLTQSNQSLNVTLQRPFGKIRLIATDALNENNKQTEVPKTISIDFGNAVIPTAFNAFDGTVIEGSTTEAGTVSFDAVKENTVVNKTEKDNVYLLGFHYFFESSAIPSYAMDVTVTSDEGNVIGQRSLSSIPVQENKLTTIIGNFYTNEGNIEVVVEDAFDVENEEPVTETIPVTPDDDLQAIIDAAEPYAVIELEPGIYSGNYNFVAGKSLTFRGANAGINPNTDAGSRQEETIFEGTLGASRLSTDVVYDMKIVIDGIKFVGDGTKIGNSSYNAIGDLTVQNCIFEPTTSENNFFIATNHNATESCRSTIRLINNHIGNTTTDYNSYYPVRLWAVKNVEVIGNVFEVDPEFAGLQHVNISDLSGSEDASIIVKNNTFTNGPAGVTITSWKVGETPWDEDLFTGTIEITGNTFNNVGLTSIENPLRNNVPIFISPEYVNDDATQGRVQDHGQFDADITVEDNTYNGGLRENVIVNLTVHISTVDELKAAIKNQTDGQKWYIAAGEYDVTEYKEYVNSGNPGWYGSAFWIVKNGIKIYGEGNPIIFARSNQQNASGNYGGQNTITVEGDNVEIDGITVMGIQYENSEGGNKAVAISGADNFTFKNSTILPAENGNGGSLLFESDMSGKTALVENTKIMGALITRYMNHDDITDITLRNVEIDPTQYKNYSAAFSTTNDKTQMSFKDVVTVDGELKLHVYDSENSNIQDIFKAIPDGSTVILHGNIQGPVVNGDPYYTNALKIISKITLTCEDDATLSGIVELNAPMTLDHVNYYYKGENTTYGNIWIGSDDVVIKNSVLFAEYDMNHSVAPNSDRDRSGEFGFIRPVKYNLQLLNNTIQTNAMGIFGGGLPGGIIKGNTFKNLDGYTSRTVWLNWADMNNLTIEGNTIYNRHMVLGGNATITGNKFLELGANGTSGHAFYFWSAFTGSISGNEYSQVDPTQPLATGQNGVTIPDID